MLNAHELTNEFQALMHQWCEKTLELGRPDEAPSASDNFNLDCLIQAFEDGDIEGYLLWEMVEASFITAIGCMYGVGFTVDIGESYSGWGDSPQAALEELVNTVAGY